MFSIEIEIRNQAITSLIVYYNHISQELNYNVTTNCFMSRGQDNNQATKLRVSKNKDKQ